MVNILLKVFEREYKGNEVEKSINIGSLTIINYFQGLFYLQ
jgi:hypothetical protein